MFQPIERAPDSLVSMPERMSSHPHSHGHTHSHDHSSSAKVHIAPLVKVVTLTLLVLIGAGTALGLFLLWPDAGKVAQVAERAQRMGMVLPGAPLFMRLGEGEGLGERSDPAGPLELTPAPPALPAVLSPEPEVTIVRPPEGELPAHSSGNSSGDTTDGAASGDRGRDRNGSQESPQSQQSQQSRGSDAARSARD